MKLTLDVYHDVRQGGRQYMEDIISIDTNCDSSKQNLNEKEEPFVCFYVFDGHGGVDAAKFAEKHLHKIISSQEGFNSKDDDVVLKAIRSGFLATHKLMWNVLDTWPRTHMGNHSTSGTTASMVMIRNSKMFVAHVGDSGVVVGEESSEDDTIWNAHCVTIDHKPDCPKEKKRIESIGGSVVLKAGVPRVVWKRERLVPGLPLNQATCKDSIPFLAVARSLGDLWSYCKQNDAYYVSPEPDVCVHHLNFHSTKCIILASDGLWNAISPSDAVKLVKKCHDNSDNLLKGVCRDPASLLVGLALKKCGLRYIKADNTSSIVILLSPLPVQQSPQIHSSSSSQLSYPSLFPSLSSSTHSPSILSSKFKNYSISNNTITSNNILNSSNTLTSTDTFTPTDTLTPPEQSLPNRSSFSCSSSTSLQHTLSTPPKLSNSLSSSINTHSSSCCCSISSSQASSFSSFPSSFNSSLFPSPYKSHHFVALSKQCPENKQSLKICNGKLTNVANNFFVKSGQINDIYSSSSSSSNSGSSSYSSSSSSSSSENEENIDDDVSDDSHNETSKESSVKDKAQRYRKEVIIPNTNNIHSACHSNNGNNNQEKKCDDGAETKTVDDDDGDDVGSEKNILENKLKVPCESNKENVGNTLSDVKSDINMDINNTTVLEEEDVEVCCRHGSFDLSVRFLTKSRPSVDAISSMTRLNDKLLSQPLYVTRSKINQHAKRLPCTLPQISHFMTKPKNKESDKESFSDERFKDSKLKKEVISNRNKSSGVVSINDENDNSHFRTDVLNKDKTSSFSVINTSHKNSDDCKQSNWHNNTTNNDCKDEFNLLELCKAAYDDLNTFNDKPLPQQPVCFLDGLATGTGFDGQSSSLYRLTSDHVLSVTDSCASNFLQNTPTHAYSRQSNIQTDAAKNHFCNYTMLKSKGFVNIRQKSSDLNFSLVDTDLDKVNTTSDSMKESLSKSAKKEFEISDGEDDRMEDETPFTERLLVNTENLQESDNKLCHSYSPILVNKISNHNKRKSKEVNHDFCQLRKKSKLSTDKLEELSISKIDLAAYESSSIDIKVFQKDFSSSQNVYNAALSVPKLVAVDEIEATIEASNIETFPCSLVPKEENDNKESQNDDSLCNQHSPSSSPENITLDDTDSNLLLPIEACA